jgi:hypothetical protein
MSRIKHLQLVLPQALAQLRLADQQAQSSLLAHWLASGERQRLWQADDLSHARLDPWQHSLLYCFNSTLRAQGLASAKLHWRGEGGAWRGGTALHLEFVHLAAGLDDLRLVTPPPATVDETTQLLGSLQPSLSLAGFELLASPSAQADRWYVHCARELQVITYSPRGGFATRLYDIMPQGTDGPDLRRLMTEVQMVLHEHPVNQQRAQRGVPALNALWFWGAAQLDLVAEQATQRVLSNHAYVRGLCEHLHLEYWPLPADAQSVLSVEAHQQLLVLPDMMLPQLEAIWLQPLQSALQRGVIEQLDVYVDHWHVSLRGGRWAQLRRRLAQRQPVLAEVLA